MHNKSPAQITLLTHLSYDNDGSPYIGSALPLTEMFLPRGRLTGLLGRVTQAALKAEILWPEKVNALYGKPLSKVELYIQDTESGSINQSIDDVFEANILNIYLAQTSLTDQLARWSDDKSYVKTLYLGDRKIFRRIANNPEIINELFQVAALCNVRAIIWPAIDPDNKLGYIKMITLRSLDDAPESRVFNFDGDSASIRYCRSTYQNYFSAHEMANEIYCVLGLKPIVFVRRPIDVDRKPFVFVSRAAYGAITAIMIEFNGSPAQCRIYVSLTDTLVIIDGAEIKNEAKKDAILELIGRFLLHNEHINNSEYKWFFR